MPVTWFGCESITVCVCIQYSSKEFFLLSDAKKAKKKKKDREKLEIDEKAREEQRHLAEQNKKNRPNTTGSYQFTKPSMPPVSYSLLLLHTSIS